MNLVLMRLTCVGTLLANSKYQIRKKIFNGHMPGMSIIIYNLERYQGWITTNHVY